MQTTFSELEYAAKKKRTRCDRFLANMEAVTPWTDLVAVIEPHYPKGERGRQPDFLPTNWYPEFDTFSRN